jgi:hypothetical protein
MGGHRERKRQRIESMPELDKIFIRIVSMVQSLNTIYSAVVGILYGTLYRISIFGGLQSQNY